jgi:hypothetical protein
MSENDLPNTQQIFIDLMGRCKEAKAWKVSCFVDEAWVPNGRMPFDMTIKDGVFTCRVIASNLNDARQAVSDFLPVITFID